MQQVDRSSAWPTAARPGSVRLRRSGPPCSEAGPPYAASPHCHIALRRSQRAPAPSYPSVRTNAVRFSWMYVPHMRRAIVAQRLSRVDRVHLRSCAAYKIMIARRRAYPSALPQWPNDSRPGRLFPIAAVANFCTNMVLLRFIELSPGTSRRYCVFARTKQSRAVTYRNSLWAAPE